MPTAKQIRLAQIRAAGLAAVALTILGVLVVLLAGPTLFERFVPLRALIPDATGLIQGSPVRLNGVQIGEVEGVQLSGSNRPDQVVLVRMSIMQRYLSQIPKDSNVQISSETVIGDKYVDITKGESQDQARPNDILPLAPQPEVLKALDLQQFQARMAVIDSLLADIEQGKGGFGQLVRGDQLYNQLRDSLLRLQRSLEAAISSQAAVGKIVYTDVIYEQLLKPIRSVERRLDSLLHAQTGAGRFLNDPKAYDDLTAQIAKLRHRIEDLRSGQGRVGRFLESDEIYVRTNRSLTRLIERLDAFAYENRLFSSAQLYESINGAARNLQSTVREFRSDPQKFLRIDLGLF